MDHITDILIQLFAILVATKIGHELLRRLGQPSIVGEILGGVVAGPAILGVYRISDETQLFAEIGVVLLLFQVGLATRLHELMRVGGTAFIVAVLGVAFPFAAAFGLTELISSGDLALGLFLGAALTATSVGITSSVLRDLGALETTSGRVILGAAVADDVLGIMVLSIAAGVANGAVSMDRIVSLLVVGVLFIVIVAIAGTRVLRTRGSLLTAPRFADSAFLPGMIVMLGLAALASLIGLAAIIGAFLAGMVVGEAPERPALEAEVAPVAAFFTPFFFGAVGAQVDLAGLGSVGAVAVLVGVTALAIIAKFLGAYLGSIRQGRDRALLIGWGMVPRGEVGLVVAGLGLSTGAIGHTVYSVVVGMAIITTLIVPPFLPALVRRAEPDPGRAQSPDAAGEAGVERSADPHPEDGAPPSPAR
jgi:Kef-type K+ transport system membrane component KefB